ncbi:MAG: phosphatidylglycerophosphatase A [Gammaproteobacteria bacterium]
MKKKISARDVVASPANFIAFGFGSGVSPVAPGTLGTLTGVMIYALLPSLSVVPYIVMVVVFFVLGIWVCNQTTQYLGVHDHPGIVWDEIVGYLITMVAVPFEWLWVMSGFLLFRLFDIWKPWPISVLDKQIKGGLGIMLDDVLAAVYAAICMQLIMALA